MRIDHEDFWLTSDGGYQGPNAVWRDILHVKPSCALSNPGVEPVLSDFQHVLQNLQLLAERCVTPGFSSGKSLFCTDHQGVGRFQALSQSSLRWLTLIWTSGERDALPAGILPLYYESLYSCSGQGGVRARGPNKEGLSDAHRSHAVMVRQKPCKQGKMPQTCA